MSLIDQVYDPEQFRAEGYRLIDLLAEHYRQCQQAPEELPAIDYEDPRAKRAAWTARLETGVSDPQDIFRAVLAESVHLHHPHYMGHQICPPAPLAALAGLLGDSLNNGMAIYEMGMASSAAEVAAAHWTAQQLGFGPQAGGFFTSGGTLANLTALLTARAAKARAAVWTEGQQQPLALMVSEEAHYCVDRAARIMGWGEAGVIKVPSDAHFRLRTDLLPDYLARARRDGLEVIAVVGSACATAAGAFDDLHAIADFCEANDLWFHVDGAHGAALAFAPAYAHHVAGLERADSVAMDYHKMLLTPSITTALLYKQHQESFRTFMQRADYLLAWDTQDDWYNLARRTFECTKLMIGLKAYTLIACHGRPLFEEYVTRVCDLARALARQVEDHPEMALLTPPSANIICFRHQPAGLDGPRLSDHNRAIRQAMLEEGEFYIVQTRIRQETWLRCVLTNAQTQPEHLRAMLSKVQYWGKRLLEDKQGPG
ncbi:MAG: pyridoxal-dependent decarboxylase [Lewinella sp.]|nr:pyridoxal-dependent decarboxylase [Lewinella sp.]